MVFLGVQSEVLRATYVKVHGIFVGAQAGRTGDRKMKLDVSRKVERQRVGHAARHAALSGGAGERAHSEAARRS